MRYAGQLFRSSSYLTKGFTSQAFVVNEVKGAWRKGIEVPGTAALNVAGGGALVASISCAAPGNCSAAVTRSPAGQIQAYVVSEVTGGSKKTITLPRELPTWAPKARSWPCREPSPQPSAPQAVTTAYPPSARRPWSPTSIEQAPCSDSFVRDRQSDYWGTGRHRVTSQAVPDVLAVAQTSRP